MNIVSYGFADDSVTAIPENTENAPLLNADSGKTEPSDVHNDFDESDEFDDFAEFNDAQASEVYDPLSGYNRLMTRVNDDLYVWAFRPLAKGYCFIARKPVRLAIQRFFSNTLFPVNFVNNLLQMKVKRAGIETARFCVNTTLGIAGFFDPAETCMGLNAFPEDFGQTLGYYGFGSGCHIVIPLIGPSNLRDLLGMGPDRFLYPTSYLHDLRIIAAIHVSDHLNKLSLYLEAYDALRAEAIDLYIFQRDAYEMRRQKQIEE